MTLLCAICICAHRRDGELCCSIGDAFFLDTSNVCSADDVDWGRLSVRAWDGD